jgi:hypothetical protein
MSVGHSSRLISQPSENTRTPCLLSCSLEDTQLSRIMKVTPLKPLSLFHVPLLLHLLLFLFTILFLLHSGRFFIDRPARPFERILNFLRTGEMIWPGFVLLSSPSYHPPPCSLSSSSCCSPNLLLSLILMLFTDNKVEQKELKVELEYFGIMEIVKGGGPRDDAMVLNQLLQGVIHNLPNDIR